MGLVRCECGGVFTAGFPVCPGCGRCPCCGTRRVSAASERAACPACGTVCCDGCGRCHGCGATRFAVLGPCGCGYPAPEKVAAVERSFGPARPRSGGCLEVVLLGGGAILLAAWRLAAG